MPGGDLREQPGLTIHRDLLASDEITNSGGAPVTTALRTAWGLARWLLTVEAVVALGALGLPRPELQYPVYDSRGEFVARLDMAIRGASSRSSTRAEATSPPGSRSQTATA